MKSPYEKYNHVFSDDHSAEVWVRKDLKGEHADHCLCYDCEHFKPEDREANCEIANDVFENCKAYDIVTPVWECPNFWEKQ